MKIRAFFRRLKNGRVVKVREHTRKDKSKQESCSTKTSGQEYREHMKAAKDPESFRPPKTREEISAWDDVARQVTMKHYKRR